MIEMKTLLKIAALLCLTGLTGCAVSHGEYRVTSAAGGMFRNVSDGTGQTHEVDALWIPVYQNY